MTALRTALALALALAFGAACTKDVAPLVDNAFAPGQRYRYATRDTEPESTFLVLKVEQHEAAGRVVHIRTDGLKLKNASDSSGYSDTITHMPFAEDALRSSTRDLVKEAEALPDFQLAYDTWRQAFFDDGAGIFTVPLGQAVQVMENAIRAR
jgi:hypothetical protein